MTQTAGEIQAHIRETLEDLDANLNELGQKVKSATDWRQHFQKSPGDVLGLRPRRWSAAGIGHE